MSGLSRTKGKAGEREAAAAIRAELGLDVRRRVRQHDADSDLLGVPGWSIEVKRYRTASRADLARWWQQAVDQADPGELPVVLYRLDRDGWRAIWPLSVAIGATGDTWLTYPWTCDTTLQAWAAVFREHDALQRITA